MEVKQYINEVWKPIRGLENLYEVSNFGRVRSLDRMVNHRFGKQLKRGILLKPFRNRDGYLMVCLAKDGKEKKYTVHRLVAIAFVPNPNNLPEVNHKDENKTNNIWTNLEWVDSKTNSNYGTRNQRISKTKTNGKRSKPMILTTKHGIYLHEWPSVNEAARQTGINDTNISYWCRGRKCTILPFNFKYKSIKS